MRPALWAILVLCSAHLASALTEEFVGALPSWRDVKKDYGAVGDGKADDTAAIQRGLDTLLKHSNSCVLYFPMGTYRITKTLKTIRKEHTDNMGVALVGFAPENTMLQWDGPEHGTMLEWDAWYSKVSRLTFSGRNKARIGLLYGPSFSTYNETSDVWFTDLHAGLVFGGATTQGQAENEVLRCEFRRCETGVQTVNWNSMDIWVWYSEFFECGRAVHNVMGNWHVWESLFRGSRISDLSTVNLMAFSAVNNTSIGSRRFFDFATGHTWGSPVSLTGNRVIDPADDFPVRLDNAGPYLVADNAFVTRPGQRAVRMTWGDQTFVGNVYSTTNAVEERGRFRRLAETFTSKKVPTDFRLQSPPHFRYRKLFSLDPGSTADAIQRAINEAVEFRGQRAVVHLPMGRYKIDRTLVIPAGADVQLIGDNAAETGSRLDWVGPADGVLLRIEGPSHATVRDLYIHAPNARGILVTNADQEGGRILADQLLANGPHGKTNTGTAAVRVAGLQKTDVLMRALQGSGNSGTWVEVIGGTNAGPRTNQVSIFTGATGSAAGQYSVRNNGSLVVRGVYHERSSDSLNGLRLAGRGTLSIDATRFSYATSPASPTFAAGSFEGLFTLATSILMPVESKASCRFDIRGDGSRSSILALNNQFWIHEPTTTRDVWKNSANPPGRGGLVGCNVNTSNKGVAPNGFAFLDNVGEHADPAKSKSGAGPLADSLGVHDETILEHLKPLRTARVWQPQINSKPGVTDLQFHRVMVTGGTGAAVEFR